MARLRYLWIIESKMARWKNEITSGKRGPKPDENGMLTFGKGSYGLDPQKFRTWKVNKRIRKGTYQVQIWKESDPSPINFFHVKTPDPKFTAEMIKTMSKSKRIRDIIQAEQFDIVKIALILSLVGNIAVIGWLISLAAGGH